MSDSFQGITLHESCQTEQLSSPKKAHSLTYQTMRTDHTVEGSAISARYYPDPRQQDIPIYMCETYISGLLCWEVQVLSTTTIVLSDGKYILPTTPLSQPAPTIGVVCTQL